MRNFFEEILENILEVLAVLGTILLVIMGFGGCIMGITIMVVCVVQGVPILIFLGLLVLAVGVVSAACATYIMDNH